MRGRYLTGLENLSGMDAAGLVIDDGAGGGVARVEGG